MATTTTLASFLLLLFLIVCQVSVHTSLAFSAASQKISSMCSTSSPPRPCFQLQLYLDHRVVLRYQEFHGNAAQEQVEQDVVRNKSRQEARNGLEAPNADGTTSATDGSSNSLTTTTNDE
jgi:hypothetical protein